MPAQRTPPVPADPPPVPPPPAPARPRRLRLVLAVVGGALAMFCLTGSAIAFILYDNYTTPDRSEPDVVVDNYLRAYLVDRNEVQTDQQLCSGDRDLAAIEALRAEVERRERDFDVNVKVVWGALDRTVTPRGETIATTLRIGGYAVADGTSRSNRTERWEFDLVEEDGWRVCAARKIG